MNTVLDDNMMLCLANGERIKLKPDMRMLFEVCVCKSLVGAQPLSPSRHTNACSNCWWSIHIPGTTLHSSRRL